MPYFVSLLLLLFCSILPLTGESVYSESHTSVISSGWLFYPGQWLSADDPRWTDPVVDKVQLPASWNSLEWKEKKKGAASGIGTYKVTLNLPLAKDYWGLSWTLMGCAAKIYVNQDLKAQLGQLGKTVDQEVPENRPDIILLPKGGSVTLVIQLSNYHHVDGGLWNPLVIGSVSVLRVQIRSQVAWDLLLAGAYLLLGLVSIFIGIYLKKDPICLWFGLFCFVLGIRIIFHSHFTLYWVYPDWNWEWFQKIRHLTMYLLPLFFLKFINHFYARKLSGVIFKIFEILCYCGCFMVLLLPYRYYGNLMYPFAVVWAGATIFLVYSLIRLRLKTSSDFKLVTVGLVFFLFGSALEFMRVTFFLQIPEFMPLTTFILVIFLGLSLADYLTKAFREIEVLNKEINMKNKDLMRLNDNKDTVLAVIAHDLRGSITGASRYVNKKLLPKDVNLEEKRAAIETLADTLSRTSSLMENLLYWAQSQTNTTKMNFEEVKIFELANEYFKYFKNNIRLKNLTLEIDICNGVVYADKQAVSIVLRNIINNAIKFTPQGGKIHISFKEEERYWAIKVSDNGIGMSENHLTRIFSIKHQIKTNGTNGERGSGFGLLLCKEYIEKSKGYMEVKSLEGKGSDFILYFPKAKSHSL